MTTKDSPIKTLRQQATRIALHLKMAERGEIAEPKIKAARQTATFKTAIAMDDKIITVEFPWEIIRDSTTSELSELIVKHMREETEN